MKLGGGGNCAEREVVWQFREIGKSQREKIKSESWGEAEEEKMKFQGFRASDTLDQRGGTKTCELLDSQTING